MRTHHIHYRMVKLLLLLILVGAQSACSLFSIGDRQLESVSRDTADGFRLEVPRPAYTVSVDASELNNNTSNRLPSGFYLKSFIENVFAERVKSDQPASHDDQHVASIKRPTLVTSTKDDRSEEQTRFCQKVDHRLSSITLQDCMATKLVLTDHQSSRGEPIFRSRFESLTGVTPTGRVMLIGGVHGDELSSVSIVFEWMNFLRANHDGEFVWDVIPVMNPDGFFAAKASRTNANGVDLNRNMPTSDWAGSALHYWQERTHSAPRKYPGESPGSEPETRWLVQEIDRFQPDMIVTVHAPYNLIDYDAPSRKNAPRRFGRVKGGLLGTYPGSLGNYAGVKRGIPVVTIELPSANQAMSEVQAHDMWADMLSWLEKTIPLENQRFEKNRRYAKLKSAN